MADLGMDIPNDWDKIASANTSEVIAAEYSGNHEKALRFVVAVHRRGIMGERYQLQLSTIDPGPDRTRHDYLVEEYDSRVESLRDMEEFLVHVGSKLNSNDPSREYPDRGDVQEIVDGFTDSNRLLDMLGISSATSK
jgi:hypothetical protein